MGYRRQNSLVCLHAAVVPRPSPARRVEVDYCDTSCLHDSTFPATLSVKSFEATRGERCEFSRKRVLKNQKRIGSEEKKDEDSFASACSARSFFLTTFHGLHAISPEIIQFRIAAIIHVHMTYVKSRPRRGSETDTVCAVSYATIALSAAGRAVRRGVGGIHRELSRLSSVTGDATT